MPDFTKIRYVRYVKDLLNINRAKDFGLHSLIATTYRYQSRVSYMYHLNIELHVAIILTFMTFFLALSFITS